VNAPLPARVSETFDPTRWRTVEGFEELTDLTYHRGVDRGADWFRGLVRLFAAGTVVFWAVRLPMILLNDHPAGFLIVHTVLAVVSVVAAIAAWRSLDRPVVGGRSTADLASARP